MPANLVNQEQARENRRTTQGASPFFPLRRLRGCPGLLIVSFSGSQQVGDLQRCYCNYCVLRSDRPTVLEAPAMHVLALQSHALRLGIDKDSLVPGLPVLFVCYLAPGSLILQPSVTRALTQQDGSAIEHTHAAIAELSAFTRRARGDLLASAAVDKSRNADHRAPSARRPSGGYEPAATMAGLTKLCRFWDTIQTWALPCDMQR